MADPLKILEALGVTTSDRIFVLGLNEHRITIYSQQCRAINLVWALLEVGRISPGAKVAVVGGGMAGVTAATSFARAGAQVTLFERAPRLLNMQQGSHTRYIHPHLYDWPEPGWDQPSATIPVLDWAADSAGVVVEHLRKQIEGESAYAFARIEGQVTAIEPAAARNGVHLSFNAPGSDVRTFDLAVIAVGFGRELHSDVSRSYWADDDLHQLDEGRILISGCGDGGITDALRACIGNFEHSELPGLLSGPWLEPLATQLLTIERDPAQDAFALREAYRHEFLIEEVLARLQPRVMDRIGHVVINGRTTASPFERTAAPLNRFLLAHLMELGLQFQHGAVEVTRNPDDAEYMYSVRYDTATTSEFDRVILRHGPANPPLADLQLTPRLLAATHASLPMLTDVSRDPAWPKGFLAPPTNDPGESQDGSRGGLSLPPSPDAESSGPKTHSVADDETWQRLTIDDLTPWEQMSWQDPMLDFLDGSDPSWQIAVQRRVPEREAVRSIVEDLKKRIRPKCGPGLSRITGPSGEGKSTILRQVVVNMLGHGSRPVILFRNGPVRTLPWELIEQAPLNRPLILVADDAHDLGRAFLQMKSQRMSQVHTRRTSAPIHVLVCATTDLWDATFIRPPLVGAGDFTTYDAWHITGLTGVDADRILTCLEAQADTDRALGQLAKLSPPQRRDALVRSAVESSNSREGGALLGALLEQRTGKRLDEHVAELMQHLANTRLPSGHELLSLYLHIGTLQFHGLGAVDQETLATALDFPYEGLTQIVSSALPTEVKVIESRGGRPPKFRIRHDAIARAAFARAASSGDLIDELAAAHRALVNAVVRLNPDGWKDPILSRVFYLSTELVANGHAAIAIAAAEGASSALPQNIHLVTKLAWVLRESGTPDGGQLGATRLSEFLERYYAIVYEKGSIRALVTEWAVCCGTVPDNPVRAARENLCLALFAMCDEIGSTEAMSSKELGRILVTAGFAASKLDQLATDDVNDIDFANLVAIADAASVTNFYVRPLRQRMGSDAKSDPRAAVDGLIALYEKVRAETNLWILQRSNEPFRLDTVASVMGLPSSF